jgi:hypothetical protein
MSLQPPSDCVGIDKPNDSPGKDGCPYGVPSSRFGEVAPRSHAAPKHPGQSSWRASRLRCSLDRPPPTLGIPARMAPQSLDLAVGRLELEQRGGDPSAVAHTVSLQADRSPGSVLRGPHRDRTLSHISHLSRTPHRIVERSRLTMRGVNGRRWYRTPLLSAGWHQSGRGRAARTGRDPRGGSVRPVTSG